ncbi:hypothetical protein WL1483_4341 [Aeromonas schubertii]|uniref:Uncharacterized protein n=1 Tax=Aeromonas schubertii TaxID=652 RepID=A0A0S2SPZ1_9GAMM|nr:hypothetical protein WL1483_4341 [Aeromonas schubertii]
MEVSPNPFRCALNECHGAWVDCLQGTGAHLFGLLGVLGANLPVLGDMQALDCMEMVFT